MGKYLWIGIALLFVSGNAAGFKDIDKDAHSFLSDLREAAGGDDEFLDDEELDDDIDAPILRAPGGRLVRRHRPIGAVADGCDPVARDEQRLAHVLRDLVGPLF